MLALLAAMVVSATAPVERNILPFQGDLSAVAGLGTRTAAGVAVFVGLAAGLVRPPWGTPFGALGFEFVQASSFFPFRASYGVQLRGGYAWSFADSNPETTLPDLMVFGRVTPFVGSNVGLGDGLLPPGLQYGPSPDGALGVRVGVGVTSAWWMRTFLFHRRFVAENGFLGDMMNVFTHLLLTPVALLNHVELVAELVSLPGASTLTVRFGCGF